MNILELKFTEADFAGKDIASLPDRPSDMGMSAAELKARFDMIPKILLAMGAFNRLIDALSTDGAEAIGIKMDLEQIRADITTLKHLEEPRNAAELARVQAELERIHAELARVQAEALRVEAENLRADSENTRKTQEAGRQIKEGERIGNELERLANETLRINNESEREEKLRNFAYQGTYENRQYRKNNMVKHNGSMYFANKDTQNVPPHSDWVLIGIMGEMSDEDILNVVLPNLNQKVDKESGKGLSTNDYINEDKNKLQQLPNHIELDNKFESMRSFDIEDFADLKGCTRYEEKLSTGVWQVLYKKNNIRIVEQFIHPKNPQGKHITTIKLYNDIGTDITKSVTITEYKQGNQWITEVV